MSSIILDLQTVLWLCYVTNALLALVLASAGPRFRGAWVWVGGSALMALGTICDALNPELPSWVSMVAGNSCYAAASVLYFHSVWIFSSEKPFPAWVYGFIPLQAAGFAIAHSISYLASTVLFSFWMSLGPLATGILLVWNLRGKFRGAGYLTALPFLVLGLASLARLGLLYSSARSGMVEAASQLNVWYVSGAILLSTVMLFGYFMMTSIRSTQMLNDMDRDIHVRNQQLMEAHRSKDLFFAIVAHDLRAPIGGAARYVRKHLFGKMSGLEPKYNEVETLAASLEKTNDFLDKLLWWSRAQLDDWTPSSDLVDVEDCIQTALAGVETMARLKNIRLRSSPPPHPPMACDPESVKLVLGNLLSNAIKYSQPDQEVRIRTSSEGDMAVIMVEDDGIGMDQATLDRLFRIESKLSTMGTQNERGSGLGLILTKSLVERNCGRIEISSSLGRGTRAVIMLPMKTGCMDPVD